MCLLLDKNTVASTNQITVSKCDAN